MRDMIVVTYKSPRRAQETIHTLRTLKHDAVVAVHDAVAVARDADGTLHIQDSYKPTADAGAGWGALLGTILGGLALAPFTAGLSTAVAGGVVAAGALGGAALGGVAGTDVATRQKADVGLPDEFVSGGAASIQPGGSALFVLGESSDPELLAEYFRGTGGTIIRTNLTPSQQAGIQRILAGSY